jgi:Xaa-Pro dipeptidase
VELVKKRVASVFRHAGDVEALFLFNNGIVDKNFFYVTGLTDGVFDNCGFLCEPNGRMYLFSSSLEEEAARSAEGYAEILTYGNRSTRDENIVRVLSAYRKVGIPFQTVSHFFFLHLRALCGQVEWIDASAAFRNARMIKFPEEIAKIQKACEIVDGIAEAVPSVLREGMTELELSAEIDFRMKKAGAAAPSFRTIAAFGKNSSKPHYGGGDVPLKTGDAVLVDFGAESAGYCSDITRTYLTGKPGRELIELYSTVLDIQQKALGAIRPGTNAKQLEEEIRRLVGEKRGFRGRYIHSLGHSLGLDVHDGSYPEDDIKGEFSKDMVITVEPGLYIPGVYGVRIEDDVVVGTNGCRLLTRARKELAFHEIQ